MPQDRQRRTLTVLFAFALLACAAAPSAQAVTFFRAGDSVVPDDWYADVVAEPNSVIWWNQDEITFKIDDTFRTFWPEPVHQAAIRNVFNQWGGAATRDYGTVNSYYKEVAPDVWDITTLALHELGHGVGLGHPFGQIGPDNFGGEYFDRNYHFDGWDAGIPYDGTQTWVPGANTELEVMGYGRGDMAGPEALNRILSWDELNGARYLYGGFSPSNPGLNFREVAADQPANVTVRAEDLSWLNPNLLAYMPHSEVPNVPGDPTAGAEIDSAEMVFNSAIAAQVGHVSGFSASQWLLRLPSIPDLYPYGIRIEVEPSGAAIQRQTSETMGGHHLKEFWADDGAGVYTWVHPSNNHPLVGPTILGMNFDAPVTFVAAYTTDEEGEILELLPESRTEPFQHTGLPGDALVPQRSPVGIYGVMPIILEEGIVLKGSEAAPSLLTGVRLADVSALNLQLEDFNDDLLDLLGDNLDPLCVSCLGDVILGGPGPEHVLLFSDGTNAPEMLDDPSYAFHILDRPNLLNYDELLVVLDSEMEMLDGSILEHRSYSLLGRTVTGIELVLLPGDVDGDGFVGGDDLTIILSNWGLDDQTRGEGDLTGDGFIGGDDYSEVLTYWGTGTQPVVTAVPEPSMLGLLLIGGFALLRRRGH